MKKLIAILLSASVLLLPLQARRRWIPKIASGGHTTAPIFVAEYHNDFGSVSTGTISGITINSLDTVVVVIDIGVSTAVSSVTDSGGSTYSKLTSQTDSSDTRWTVEVWGTLSATASTSVTVNCGAGSNINVGVLRYTGVSSFGNVGGADSAGSTTHTVTLVMQDANNRIAMGALQRASAVGTGTAGTMRINNFNSNQGSMQLSAIDNTQAASGSLAATYTTASSIEWAGAAVELRSLP
jgi:hypothetical protein